MKLLAPVLLLLPALAAAVWSHSHGPDPNAIYRQGDFHDHGDVAGAGRYRYHDHPYGGGAAGRAAAEGGYGSDSDSGPGSGMGSGSGSGNSRHHLLHKYKRHYKPVGCNVRFRPIESLMGVGATQCAECLTATAIAGGNKSDDKKHGSYYASAGAYYAKAKCRDVCDYVPRGSEFFVPLPLLPLDTRCLNGSTCYQGSQSTSACQCCGQNLGMNYNMPPAPATDFPGPVSNFKRKCDLPVSANNCQACLLWRKLRGNYFQGNLTSLPCTQGELCFVTKDGIHTLMGTTLLPTPDPYHYLLLPGSSQADWPVIGVEDPQVLTRRLERIWDLAWKLAFDPYSQLPFTPPFSVPDLPVANYSCRVGIALNPASARSQHQMHIHIARVPTPLRQLLVGREENYGQWTKVRIPITRQNYSSWPIAYVRYFSLGGGDDDNNSDGDTYKKKGYYKRYNYSYDNMDGGGAYGGAASDRPSDYRIFNQAFNFARRSFLRLQAWGILIIPDEESIYLRDKHASLPRGFYLVLSTHNRYGTWNSYRAAAVNANFEPELLLCTSYSTGNGSYWYPKECFADLLMRSDCAPGLRATLEAGASRRFTDALVAQQIAQDGGATHNHGSATGSSGGGPTFYGAGSGTGATYYGGGAGSSSGAYYGAGAGAGAGNGKNYYGSGAGSGSGNGDSYGGPGAGNYADMGQGSGNSYGFYMGAGPGGGSINNNNYNYGMGQGTGDGSFPAYPADWYSVGGAPGGAAYMGTGAGTGAGIGGGSSAAGTGAAADFHNAPTGAGAAAGNGAGAAAAAGHANQGMGAGTGAGAGAGAADFHNAPTGAGAAAGNGAGAADFHNVSGAQSFGLRGSH